MSTPRWLGVASALLGAACAQAPSAPSVPVAPPPKLRVHVTLSKDLGPEPVSGRLLVLASNATKPADELKPGIDPTAPWIAGFEVARLAPGETVDIDPDKDAFPGPLSTAPPGDYQWQVILDVDHDLPYRWHKTAGDLEGPVVRDPIRADASDVRLTLSRRVPPEEPDARDKDLVAVERESPLLSAFWKKPIKMRAVVALPPGAEPGARYPGVYFVHGFGGTGSMDARRHAPEIRTAMAEGRTAKKVLVFLDGSFATGHHEFADSANNGPWARALVEELIPYLEATYPLVPEARARFLSGHSSGGWSTLWLQVTHPAHFGGTWSTAPDPVDFRSFTGIDATPGSTDNFYRRPDGKPHELVREGEKEVLPIREYARFEQALGPVGGQMASFEWVFSPRGPDGAPLKLFDRATGALDARVLAAWQSYDIRRLLARDWDALAPKLRGKLHLIVGSLDTFHLDESMKLLCELFAEKHSDATCEVVPGRSHFDLYKPYDTYPKGLLDRILTEMDASFAASRSAP